MRRREFFRSILLTIGGLGVLDYLENLQAEEGTLPRRTYGKTSINLSIVGLGGASIMKLPQKKVNEIVSWAIDRGVNYFDVAPTYGESEILYGKALKKYRKKIFLACKTLKRDAKGAEKEFYSSLKRLQTDYIDLYQFHAISRMEDVEKIFAPGGAMELFFKARERGLIRFIGFSAHSEEAALEALNRFKFDSVLYPVNFVMFYRGNFGPKLLKKAKEKGVSVLAIKSIALQRWRRGQKRTYPRLWYEPLAEPEKASLAIRFTLSQPVKATIPPADPDLFKLVVNLAMKYTPIRAEETQFLKKLSLNYEPIFSLQS